MQLSDTREIAAPPEVVWAAILDPDVLMACVPGCKEMTGTPEEGFQAVVVQKVGPVKATFKGMVTLSEMTPVSRLKLSGEGKGGAAGFAKGGAEVTLAESEVGTTLNYDVEAKVGGKLAQLGSRIIDGFAKKMADQFFTNLKDQIEGPKEAADAEAAPAAGEGEAAETDAAPGKKGWFRSRTT